MQNHTLKQRYMKVLSFCLLSLLTVVSVFSQNYEISITLNSRNDTVLLGHYFAKNDLWIRDDTVVLKNGKGVFRGNRKLPKGVYFIYDNRSKFDIIIGDQQEFGIVADTANFIQHTKFTNSSENDVFYDFNRYNAERSVEYQRLNEQLKTATTDDERTALRTQLQTLINERIAYILKLIDANPELFVAKFLKTLIPPDYNLPEPPKDDGEMFPNVSFYIGGIAHISLTISISTIPTCCARNSMMTR